jgi:STE24 endopeptidase
MHDWNSASLIIVFLLFLLWKLEMIATILDRKTEPQAIPAQMRHVMDEATLHKGRLYRMDCSRFEVFHSAIQLAILLGFWFAGGFAWFDAWVRSFAGNGIISGLWLISLWFVAQSLLGLPYEIWTTFVHEKRYGFNRSTPATFVLDRLKGLALAGLIGLPVIAALLWILATLPHAWLWAWLALASFQFLMVWLAPTYIMPLFNRFTPMADGDLKTSIEELGKECQFPLNGVFIMDGSRRSSKANAFFTGIGKHKKIALFDTLVETCPKAEVIAVLAHEIGHFRCGHIRSRLIAGLLNLGVLCFLLGICTDPSSTIARTVFDAFGVQTISPQVGLILFGILMTPVSTVVSISLNAWSRQHEFEADAFARKAIGSGKPLADALLRMTNDHLAHPTPSRLRVWLDYSHPPLLERLEALESQPIVGG